MFVSDEFRKMAERFIQDIDIVADSKAALAKFVLGDLTPAELTRLRAYLSEIVTNRYSDEQLINLWNTTPTEIEFFHGNELRNVLTFIRDQIK